MLIKSTSPKLGAVPHRPSRGEALAKKMAKEEVPIKELYDEGSWKFTDGESETYNLNRENAVGFMDREGASSATFTVWGAKGDYDSLSSVDQQKRKSEAKTEAIAKGIGTSIFGSVLLAGGAAVVGVLGSVGSLLTRSGGGGGLGIGLGALGAIAGGAGLVVGIASYREGLQSPVAEIIQEGFARRESKGFRFEPIGSSADKRDVVVTEKSVKAAKPLED